MAATNLTFAGNSLQTANILTNTIDHFSIPVKDAKLYALAHANRSAIPFVSYPSKTIVVSGVIIDTSVAALDARLDTFRNYFVSQDQNLDIDYNSGTRRYIATVNSLKIDRPGGLLFANFTIEFICTQPFGQDTGATTALTAAGRTLGNYTDPYTFLGTAPYQLPITTITCTLPTSSATNLVTNPGFEVDLSGWATSGNGGTASRVTTQHNSGVAAMQMVNAAALTGGFAGGEQYSVASGAVIGQSYTVVAWVKGNAGGEALTITENSSQASISLNLTNAWLQVILTFTNLSATPLLKFQSTTLSATWFLDDVSMTQNTSQTIFWGNNGNGQGVFVTRIWLPGDVLVVDCLNKNVTVNGLPVAFTGAFPEFPPGAQNFSYSDTFTSRTFTILSTYNVLYL